jgi:short-subunit dehydrogenase
MDAFAKRYGPWALIAGASEGIGEAFARELARRGLNLALVARRQEVLEQTAHAIARDTGVEVRCLQLDLGQEVAAATLALELADLDVGLVVYNAALAPTGRFLELSLEEQLAAIDVNVRGPLGIAHRFGRRLASRGSGGIILLSSLTAFQGSPFVATYGGTKAFLLTLAEGLWYELAPSGVDVLAVCAGATRTPKYLKRAVGRAPGELDPGQVVREALDRLGRGPLMIPGRFNRLASQLMRRLLPRRATIRIMGGQTRHLANRAD